MRGVPIVPIDLVRTHAPYSTMHLVLPQYWHHQAYRETYTWLSRERGDHIILDNGVAEGFDSATTMRKVETIARELRPTEIVAPDVIGDPKETIKRTIAYIQDVHDKERLSDSVMAVIQLGDNPQAWNDELDEQFEAYAPFLFNPVTCLGLSKFLPKPRVDIVSELEYREWNEEGMQPSIHLLGMGANPMEVFSMAKHWRTSLSDLRSNDTLLPFSFAYFQKRFNHLSTRADIRASVEVDELWSSRSDTAMELALTNMLKYMELCDRGA